MKQPDKYTHTHTHTGASRTKNALFELGVHGQADAGVAVHVPLQLLRRHPHILQYLRAPSVTAFRVWGFEYGVWEEWFGV